MTFYLLQRVISLRLKASQCWENTVKPSENAWELHILISACQTQKVMGTLNPVWCLVSNLEEQKVLIIKPDFSRLSIFVKNKESRWTRPINTPSQMVSPVTLSMLQELSNQRPSLRLRKLQTWSWLCQIICSWIKNWSLVLCLHKKLSTCYQRLDLLSTSCTNGMKILKIFTNTWVMIQSSNKN